MAERSGSEAQFRLGLMYAYGKGVPMDAKQAVQWFRKAAAQGNKQASKNRDITASEMTPGELDEAMRLVKECRATPHPKR